MKTKFGLVFDDRDDGTKVWSAECQGCGALIVGERYPQVTVISLREGSPPMSPVQFDQFRQQARAAWEQTRKTGAPIVIADDRVVVASTHDSGDLQRALETHAGVCPRAKSPG